MFYLPLHRLLFSGAAQRETQNYHYFLHCASRLCHSSMFMESARGVLQVMNLGVMHRRASLQPLLTQGGQVRFAHSITGAEFHLPCGDKLTAKAERGFSADHRSPGVRCHTLVGTSILGFHWVAYHKVTRNQPVTGIWLHLYLCAVHLPPAKKTWEG